MLTINWQQVHQKCHGNNGVKVFLEIKNPELNPSHISTALKPLGSRSGLDNDQDKQHDSVENGLHLSSLQYAIQERHEQTCLPVYQQFACQHISILDAATFKHV